MYLRYIYLTMNLYPEYVRNAYNSVTKKNNFKNRSKDLHRHFTKECTGMVKESNLKKNQTDQHPPSGGKCKSNCLPTARFVNNGASIWNTLVFLTLPRGPSAFPYFSSKTFSYIPFLTPDYFYPQHRSREDTVIRLFVAVDAYVIPHLWPLRPLF